MLSKISSPSSTQSLFLCQKDNEAIRNFAVLVETYVKQGWCNEHASTINLKCIEIFTKGLPKQLRNFANKRIIKHISTFQEPSIPYWSLVALVDTEDITNERIKTQELSLEINSLSDDLKEKGNISFSNNDTQNQINQFSQNDPNNKSKPQFKKYCTHCHLNNHSVSK